MKNGLYAQHLFCSSLSVATHKISMGLQHKTDEDCQAKRSLHDNLVASYVKGSNKKEEARPSLVTAGGKNRAYSIK